ncbi:MAG: glycosyltransferase [Bacilli bacterium]|nr:glycosyltransferase [Bacilli bacterium]
MKILILCDYFEPIRFIGASRPSDFAKCFMEQGYNVEIITFISSSWPKDDEKQNNFLMKRINVDDNPHFKRYRFFASLLSKLKKKSNSNEGKNGGNQNKKLSFLAKIKLYLKSYCSTKADIIFGKCGSRALFKEAKNDIDKVDILYTTYGGFSSVLCGKRIKRRFKRVKWIADFRDGVYYPMFVKANKYYYKYFIKRNCKQCDSIVFASNGYLNDSVLPSSFKGNISVVENGFMNFKFSKPTIHKNIIFLYAGSFYGERHLFSFFDSISKLNKLHNSLNLEIVFCGDKTSFSLFFSEAREYNVAKYIIYKGNLSKDELTHEEINADVFLISSWNYKNYSGVLPGKFFEYMAFGKPIVGCVSGDNPNSLLKEMINANKLGFCSDEIDSDENIKMFHFISDMYDSFIENGFVEYDINLNYISKYKREGQAKTILSTVIKE